jgi:hypothetical protein
MIIANTKTRTVKVTGGDLLDFVRQSPGSGGLARIGSVTFEYDENGSLCDCVVRTLGGLRTVRFDEAALDMLSRYARAYLNAPPLRA